MTPLLFPIHPASAFSTLSFRSDSLAEIANTILLSSHPQWQFLSEGGEAHNASDVHRAPLPIPKLPTPTTPNSHASSSSPSLSAVNSDSAAEGKKPNMFQRGLSSLRAKRTSLSSRFQFKKDDSSKEELTFEELAMQSDAAAAAIPDGDRLRGWEGFVSSILAATVFSSSNEEVYLKKINSALKDAIKDKKFITSAEFTDLKIRDRLVLSSTGVLDPMVPPATAPSPGNPASVSSIGSPACSAGEVASQPALPAISEISDGSIDASPQCFGWHVKLPRHAISGQLHVTGKKVLSFSIKLAFSMELVGGLRSDIDFSPIPMLRVSFMSMPCFQVFLESTIKVGSLPLPIDKKLKKIIETKLREGIEKTMLPPHQLRIPLKPVGPAPTSVATQWDENDLLGKSQAVPAEVVSTELPVSSSASCMDTSTSAPNAGDSSDFSDDE